MPDEQPFASSGEFVELVFPRPARTVLSAATIGVAVAVSQATNAFTAALVTGSPYGMVAYGQEATLGFVLQNGFGLPKEVTLAWSLTSLDARVRSFTQTLTVDGSGGTAFVPVSLVGADFGHRWVDFTLTWAEDSLTDRSAFIYTTALAGKVTDLTGFRFQMNAHFDQHTAIESTKECVAMAQIGVTGVRIGVEWGSIQPAGATSFSWTQLDGMVALCEQFGFEVQMLLAYGNDFAASSAARENYNAQVALGNPQAYLWLYRTRPVDSYWRAFVHTIVLRYLSRVAWWEAWNEPNNGQFWYGSVDEYLSLMRSTYEEVKAAQSSALVMTGGFVAEANLQYLADPKPTTEMRTLLEVSDAFDFHAFHPHGDVSQLEQSLVTLAPWRAAAPIQRPMWLNEVGRTTSHSSYRQQCQATIKKIVTARASSIIGYSEYEIRDEGVNDLDDEQRYGILDLNFHPKPGYGTYNEVVRRVRGRYFYGLPPFVPAAGQRYFTFYPLSGGSDLDQMFLTVFWSGDFFNASVDMHVGPTAIAFDMQGNGLSMPYAAANVMTLLWQQDPLFLFTPIIPSLVGTSDMSGVVNALSPFARMRADINTVLGGHATSFNDLLGNGHAWVASGTGVVTPATNALANGHEIALFTGTERYVSSRPRADWNFLHQDHPRTVFVVLSSAPNGAYNNIMGTTTGTQTDCWLLYANPITGVLTSAVFGHTGSLGLLSPALPAATMTVLHLKSDTLLSPAAQLLINEDPTSLNQSDYVGFTLSTLDALATLQIGDGASEFSICEAIYFDRNLRDEETNAVLAYLHGRYGAP